MPITISPTMIKETLYLLIPKKIADLNDIKNGTKFSLSVKRRGSKNIFEYTIVKL